jgi:REP-associated tyrosine transposase
LCRSFLKGGTSRFAGRDAGRYQQCPHPRSRTASVVVIHKLMTNPTLTIYGKNPPHWRMEGCIYFVTWRLSGSQPGLRPEERSFVTDVIRYFTGVRYELFAYVVMDDHVHVLTKPLLGLSLQSIVHSWKSYSANRLQKNFGRAGPIWQHRYFDRIIRDEPELMEKARYILNNPMKR